MPLVTWALQYTGFLTGARCLQLMFLEYLGLEIEYLESVVCKSASSSEVAYRRAKMKDGRNTCTAIWTMKWTGS